MSEIKCSECGNVITGGAVECPNCGCPIVTEKESVSVINKKQKSSAKINVLAFVSMILGIVIIFMGYTVMNKDISIDTYTAKDYNVDYAAFGGDFYTEIYGASDTIVDELSDINNGIESISKSVAEFSGIIYYPIGMLIITIGIATVAMSFNHIKR